MVSSTQSILERIASALERLSPPPPSLEGLDKADAFVWHPSIGRLSPVASVAHVALDLLHGVDSQKRLILENTKHFAAGLPANNVMLWGARGMGKSSLVKAVHAIANQSETEVPPGKGPLGLIEIQRDDLSTLPDLLALLQNQFTPFHRFCDDLSFEREDADYKALKSVLDGGISGRPENVLFYATSNRRHLMPREMIENERSTAINASEATEEKVSLSDRFGLWIGFHNCGQDVFLNIVRAYAAERNLPLSDAELCSRANAWSISRSGRSGRVAYQFIENLTAELA